MNGQADIVLSRWEGHEDADISQLGMVATHQRLESAREFRGFGEAVAPRVARLKKELGGAVLDDDFHGERGVGLPLSPRPAHSRRGSKDIWAALLFTPYPRAQGE